MSASGRWAVLFACALAVGCAALPHPTPQDAEVAQRRWPKASLATLQEGRRAYVDRCSGCHPLHLPNEKRPEDWPATIEEMEAKSGAQPRERELIEQYLVTLSDAPARTRAP